jgi:hypothetical protein
VSKLGSQFMAMPAAHKIAAWNGIGAILRDRAWILISSFMLLAGTMLATFSYMVLEVLLYSLDASPFSGLVHVGFDKPEMGVAVIGLKIVGWILISTGCCGLIVFQATGRAPVENLNPTDGDLESPRYCLGCGYALCHLRSPNCPECGLSIDSYAVSGRIYLRRRVCRYFSLLSIIGFGLYNIQRVLKSQNILDFPHLFFLIEGTQWYAAAVMICLAVGSFLGFWSMWNEYRWSRWISGIFGVLNILVLVLMFLNKIGWI